VYRAILKVAKKTICDYFCFEFKKIYDLKGFYLLVMFDINKKSRTMPGFIISIIIV